MLDGLELSVVAELHLQAGLPDHEICSKMMLYQTSQYSTCRRRNRSSGLVISGRVLMASDMLQSVAEMS